MEALYAERHPTKSSREIAEEVFMRLEAEGRATIQYNTNDRVQTLEFEVASLKSTIQMMHKLGSNVNTKMLPITITFHQQFIDHLMQVGKRVLQAMPMMQKVQKQMVLMKVLKVERIKFIVICC
ncbi:hypothetical protein CJ030_MR3G009860 [Morella rubra]|uniref:Uncharacterized protein n=1 Tax=Morella rubra TaxID=262757 RepID=A0A6A1WC58_9ROSI|nr:hypothetical protein CJ030_MR3G009860 [Morella rubra]